MERIWTASHRKLPSMDRLIGPSDDLRNWRILVPFVNLKQAFCYYMYMTNRKLSIHFGLIECSLILPLLWISPSMFMSLSIESCTTLIGLSPSISLWFSKFPSQRLRIAKTATSLTSVFRLPHET